MLEQEETRFRQTLANGLKLLDEATADIDVKAGRLAGETAFKLYDTYGFPYDLTEDALRARGLSVDRGGFDAAMAQQKAAARAAWKGSGEQASNELWFDIAEEFGSTEFTGYSGDEGEGVVLAIVKDGKRVESAEVGETVEIVPNQTPFYGESGGQIGDAGKLTTLKGFVGEVEDTSKPLGRLHVLRTKVRQGGELTVGETIHQAVDADRRDRVRANHSATHLLHAALRHRLGTHVTQKGSLVAPDYFRFDFSHPKALTRDEIEQVEADVNAQIRGNEPVTTRLMTPDEAIAAGAMALFGEKYGDEVRVLRMGRSAEADYSVELCGGTHVRALGDIQLLKIIGESAVSSGVRRIEALTGEAARQWLDGPRHEAAGGCGHAQVLTGRSSRAHCVARRRPPAARARACRCEEGAGDGRRRLRSPTTAGPEQVNGHKFLGQVVEGLNPKDLRSTVDTMKQRVGSGIAALGRGQRGPGERCGGRNRRPCRPNQRGRSPQGRRRGARRSGRRRSSGHGARRRTGRLQGQGSARRGQGRLGEGRCLRPMRALLLP